MTDNPFANTPLPWADPKLDRDFNKDTGATMTLKFSEYADRNLLLVSKSKNMTMTAYVKNVISEALERDSEKLKESTDPETLQATQANLLKKRSDTNQRRERTKAKNKSAA